jgi:hypothetical protein
MKRSDIFFLLNSLPTDFLLYAMGKTESEDGKKAISLYFTGLKNMRVSLRGKDLRRMGYIPGPIYTEILRALLRARLDGKLHSRQEETDYVLGNYAKHSPTPQGRGETERSLPAAVKGKGGRGWTPARFSGVKNLG